MCACVGGCLEGKRAKDVNVSGEFVLEADLDSHCNYSPVSKIIICTEVIFHLCSV